MKRESFFHVITIILILYAFSVRTAKADGYLVSLQQVGPNVVATGSGAIDLTGLTFSLTGSGYTGLVPNGAYLGIGSGTGDAYNGASGPLVTGSGSATTADTSIGSFVDLYGQYGQVAVPHGYVSDAALSDSATYDNATFSSLGITPGTYTWTWGVGANQSFTLQVGAVPEPSTFTLAGLGLTGLLALRHKGSGVARGRGRSKVNRRRGHRAIPFFGRLRQRNDQGRRDHELYENPNNKNFRVCNC